MKYLLDILPRARLDIIEAADWYESERLGLASEFTTEIYAAIDLLSEQAMAHFVRYKRKNVRFATPKTFPYKIMYYVEGETIKVFAIVHSKRHPRVWKKRL